MNYVSHTRAAHERLLAQSDSRPHHISLYWVLFFQWNAEFFGKGGLTLDHEQVMNSARIGNRHTYRDALRDLDTWGLIAYKPSKARGTVSTCSLKVLGGFVRPEVAQQNEDCEATSGPTEKAVVGPEVAQALRPEVALQTGFVGPEVAQHSLLGKTSFKTPLPQNVGGGTKKKGGQASQGEGLSEVEVFDDTANPDEAGPPATDRPGAAPKEKVAPKRKGVKQATIREAAARAATTEPNEPRRRGGRTPRPEVPFAESELASYEAFAAAFAGTDYELADLKFYHAKVTNWRQKGQIPHRADWKATATQFFLNDAHDNRLKLAPGVRAAKPGENPTDPGIPTTGYRSSRYD